MWVCAAEFCTFIESLLCTYETSPGSGWACVVGRSCLLFQLLTGATSLPAAITPLRMWPPLLPTLLYCCAEDAWAALPRTGLVMRRAISASVGTIALEVLPYCNLLKLFSRSCCEGDKPRSFPSFCGETLSGLTCYF